MRLSKFMVVGACLATLSFSLAACGGDDEAIVDTITEQAGNATEAVGDAVDDAVNDDAVTVAVQAMSNSGITGEVKLTTENNETKVDFDLQNAAGPHPAHIHEGTCANLTAAPKFPLTDVTDGKSETTIPTTVVALETTPHAINLHMSAQDIETYVACADIPTTKAAGGTTTGSTTTAP